MNIKVKQIDVKTPSKPRYEDPVNKILIVQFDNGTEWVPTFSEWAALQKALDATYWYNTKTDHQACTGVIPPKKEADELNG
jgi:hypothetical protein